MQTEPKITDVYIAKFPFETDGKIFPEERAREIESCTNERVRAQKFYVWKLLGYALLHSFGAEIETLDMKKVNGKWTCPVCEISLSHCKNIVAVAVSAQSVGVDAEAVDPPRFLKLGGKILTESERAKTQGLSDPLYGRALNAFWTRKEAVFKRMGWEIFIPRDIDTEGNGFLTKSFFDGADEYFLTVSSFDVSDVRIFPLYGISLGADEVCPSIS